MQNNFSVLYVERDLIFKDKYTRFLRLFFKNVYVASSQKEALEKYYIYRPDILIFDIDTPQINGMKVAQEIRQFDEDIIFIVLTASSDTDKILIAAELKLFKYLIKPIKTFEIETLLKNVTTQLTK